MGTTTSRKSSEAVERASTLHDPAAAPLGDEPAEVPEVLIREARRRQRRRWAFSALAVAASIGLVAGVLASSGPPRPPRRSEGAHEGHGPLAQAAPLPSMTWPGRLVASTPHIRSVVATTTALYWITGVPLTTRIPPRACRRGSTVPVRDDPTSGARQRGPALKDCAMKLVAAGPSLWSLAVSGSSLVVTSLNPATLVVKRTETFPTTQVPGSICHVDTCATLAAGPGSVLWLTNGARIWRIDAATGAVEGGFTPATNAAALAAGSTGALLYTSGKNPTGHGTAIDEYSVTSGTRVAHVAFPLAVVTGPAQLAAGPDNVWTSYRGGMAGAASNLSSAGLASLPNPQTPLTAKGRLHVQVFSHMQGVSITATGGSLWLDSYGVLACVDPATGAVRAFEQVGTTAVLSAAAVLSGHLYGLYTRPSKHSLLVSVQVPARCLPGP
jgi:hypothetical protein